MTQPYREAEPVSIPLTDDEVAAWDQAACAAIASGTYGPERAAELADKFILHRRRRFGVRYDDTKA